VSRTRTGTILIVIGAVLLAIGLSMVVGGAAAHADRAYAFSIPAGGQYYYAITMSGLFSGETIVAVFASASGPLDVFILDQAAFNGYSYNLGVSGSLAQARNSTGGTLTAIAPGPGTYYVVLNHAPGYAGSTQSGNAEVTLSGFNTAFVILGASVSGAGGIMVAGGGRILVRRASAPKFAGPPPGMPWYGPPPQGLPPTTPPQGNVESPPSDKPPPAP
jgi:hypothetical protein